jgi:hypothetical protein
MSALMLLFDFGKYKGNYEREACFRLPFEPGDAGEIVAESRVGAGQALLGMLQPDT